MKKYISIFAALSMLCAFSGCSQPSTSPSDYMILDDVKYVNEFPQTFLLQNKVSPDIDIIGVKNLVIRDSIMILSTNDGEGLWSFFSLPDYSYLGKFLTRGNGPSEFVQAPSIHRETKFIKEGDMFLAYIYDFQKGKILEMDIAESMKNGRTHISVSHDSLPPFLFNFAIIDSSHLFCKEVNYNRTQQIRYILENNERIIPHTLQKLNQPSIQEGEDINILSTMTKLSNDNIVVEMPIGLNYINLYTLDGSVGKTICIGKELDCIEKIQRKKRWNRIYTYADLRLFSDFFGVVRIDEDEKTYQIKRKKLPSILLFDWNGEPLAELKLDHFITAFDIDFTSGTLYTLDVHSDEFYTYDIKDILAKLK